LAQVPDGDQLLVDDSVHLAAVLEVALQQVAATAGLKDWGSLAPSWEGSGAEAAMEAVGAGKDSL